MCGDGLHYVWGDHDSCGGMTADGWLCVCHGVGVTGSHFTGFMPILKLSFTKTKCLLTRYKILLHMMCEWMFKNTNQIIVNSDVLLRSLYP